MSGVPLSRASTKSPVGISIAAPPRPSRHWRLRLGDERPSPLGNLPGMTPGISMIFGAVITWKDNDYEVTQ